MESIDMLKYSSHPKWVMDRVLHPCLISSMNSEIRYGETRIRCLIPLIFANCLDGHRLLIKTGDAAMPGNYTSYVWLTRLASYQSGMSGPSKTGFNCGK